MSEYVTVEKAGNEAMADLIKRRLGEAGIPCVILSSSLAALAGSGAGYKVTVPADPAEAARALLTQS